MSERGTEAADDKIPGDRDMAASDAESAAAALAALEEPKPRRRMTWRWLALIALGLVVIVAAALPLLHPLLRAVLPSSTPIATTSSADISTQRLSVLEQQLAMIERQLHSQTSVGDLNNRLTALSGGVDALQQQVARLEQETAGLSDFDSRIAKLEEKQNDLVKQVQDGSRQAGTDPELKASVAAQGKDLAALSGQMDQLRETAQNLGGDARKVALVMALDQLDEAAEHSGSFATELKAVQDLVGQDAAVAGDPAFAVLQGRGKDGVPTLPALQADFAKIAGNIVSAGDEPLDSDWASRTLARLASIVTIRRTGEVTGKTPEAIVARAELRLAAGDLAAAVREVEQLTGPAAATAADWLAGARADLAVAQAVETLRARILAGIGAGAGKAKPSP
jgi:hypothetical protein